MSESAATQRRRDSPAGVVQAAELARRAWTLEHTGRPWVNNLTFAYRLAGALDRNALEMAVTDLVMRHDALRTTYATVDGTCVQRIAAHATCGLTSLELQDDDGEPEVVERVRQTAHSPLFGRRSLFQAALLQLDSQEHVLVVVVDHLVCDGWSIGVLSDELSACYNARSTGRAPELPPVTTQFDDFLRWQEAEKQRAGHSRYWREALAAVGPVPLLALPGAKVDLLADDFSAASVRRSLSSGETAALRQAGMSLGITESAFWLAGLALATFRMTGEADLGFLVPVSGRAQPGTANTVGWLANTIVVAIRLSGAQTLHDLVRATWTSLLGALDHQVTPWEDLVEEWYSTRQGPAGVIPQVFFSTIAPCERARLELNGLRTEPIVIDGRPSAHAVDVRVACGPGQNTEIFASYPRRLYDSHVMEKLLDGVVASVSALASTPEARLH